MKIEQQIEKAPVLNKKKFSVPHIYVILISFMLVAAISSYFVPAGVYDRVPDTTGRMMVKPDSYHIIESTPVSILQFFVAIPQGFVEAGWVIVLTFCVGGAFAVLKKTGVIELGLGYLAKKLAKRGIILIPVLMAIFAMIDAFIGMPELTMVYIPVIMPLVFALGFDSITACAIALCGSAAGFTAALTNPFTIGIGQRIAGLPLYSGLEFRIVTWIIVVTVGIVYVMRYAKKVQKNPELSQMYQQDLTTKETLLKQFEKKQMQATMRQKITGIFSVALFLTLVFGVIKFKWDMPEIGGLFIALAIISGLFSGMSGKQMSHAFNEGCHDVLIGALVIGVARGITVVMNDANIMDTIVHAISSVVHVFPSSISVLGMLIFHNIIHFLVPSGSGQTLLTMPIMAPLADTLGITRQTTMLAMQFGEGFTNILYPTAGYFMAALAIGGVPWEKWVKFVFPLILIWLSVAAVLLLIAQSINFGPF